MRTITFKTIGFLILFAVSSFAFGQNNVNIKGKIENKTTLEAIPYANVALYNIDGTEIGEGDFCNKYGEFKIENIKAGEYYLGISHVSYQNLKIKLTVKDEDIQTGTYRIEPKDLALKEISVTSSRLIASGDSNEDNNKKTSEE